jgi:hypothetical protein
MARLALAALLVTFFLLPFHALAGIPVGPVSPVGDGCVLVNDDSCSGIGPYTAVVAYGWGWEGAFVGDLVLTTDAPGYHHAYVCTNVVLAGAVLISPDQLPLGLVFPNCVHVGVDPPQGLPVTLGCESRGTGVAACTILD